MNTCRVVDWVRGKDARMIHVPVYRFVEATPGHLGTMLPPPLFIVVRAISQRLLVTVEAKWGASDSELLITNNYYYCICMYWGWSDFPGFQRP